MTELRPRSRRRSASDSADAPATSYARHGRQRPATAWRSVLALIGATLAVLLVSGASLAAIVVYQLQSNLDVVDLPGQTDGPPPSIGAFEGGFNILIVGSDKCEEVDGDCAGRGGAELNDVTMLLHVSEDQTNAVAVSFPRDLIVPIPSCPDADGTGSTSAMSARPINETLSYGGLPCTILTVEALTGLDIQFGGLITFNGVVQMSSAVGGVPVCITAPLHDSKIDFHLDTPGTHILSGANALQFLRSRAGVGDGSDLTRISSQQVFLASLVRTLKSDDVLGDPFRVYSLAQAATSNMTLTRDFASPDTLVSIALALKDIPLENVTFVQYPNGAAAGGKVVPQQSKADALFAKILADEPFLLAAAGDGKGSQLDETAVPVAPVPQPSGSAAGTAEPVVPETLDITGQTAADQTCSITN